ncbi:alpha/beta fold hydrolase [Streptomyces sp. NPDC050560]|uniref:alpha/beta fold hydrolase n=1 Tax=Streptomyces sp. NPDC050560 TaxID=3365630 RepID=UPI0037B53E86
MHTDVAGARTHWVEAGTGGTPVVLVHGASLGSSLATWERCLPRLAARGLRAVAYDQPGFGGTDASPGHSLPERAAFLGQFLTTLGIRTAHLVGHSQSGGMVVGHALEHPDTVRTVTAVATGSLLPPATGPAPAGHAEGHQGDPGREPTLDEVRAQLEANLHDPALATDEAVRARYALSTGAHFTAFQERDRIARAGGGGNKGLRARLGELTVPALFLYGAAEPGRVGERVEAARAAHPGGHYALVPHAAHLLPWEAPEEFARVVGDFVTGHG